MNYEQVRQFLVLSKTMNMTKAARELYITQPALSHALAKMEKELGLKLFFRDGNRLVMTEEGRALLPDLEAIVQAYDQLEGHARILRDADRRSLTLGFAGSVTAFSALYTYGVLTSYQGISIRKIFAEHAVIGDMLQNDQVDFAITFPPLTGRNLESRVLLHDPICLAVAGGHPLLRQHTISLSDLTKYELLSLTDDNHFVAYCNELLEQRNVVLRFRMMNYNDLMHIVDQGRNGGEILSITTRKQFSSWFGRGYRCLSISDFDKALVTAISWRRDSSFAYEYKGLVDLLEQNYDRIYFRNYRNLKPE